MDDHCAKYQQVQRRLCRGWNTFIVYSVLTHVLLPEGLGIQLGVKEYRSGKFLERALIGRQGEKDESVRPGPKTFDGSYSELTVAWLGVEFKVQTAAEGEEFVALVTLVKGQMKPAALTVGVGMMWNSAGTVERKGDVVAASIGGEQREVGVAGKMVDEANLPIGGAYLAVELSGAVGVWAGKRRTVDEIRALVEAHRAKHAEHLHQTGDVGEVYAAIQTVMAWDTIYEPAGKRAISPVSRIWSVGSGGWVLFCWDTYFAAYLAAVGSKDLAYANAVEITRERTEEGFVPNFSQATGMKSRDRSQPPVGSMMVREIFRKFREPWFVEMLFEDLLTWNRWWPKHRDAEGLLAWGSNPVTPIFGNDWEQADHGINGTFGGALESGLDNSPMYDEVPFDAERHHMKLWDVGLNGMYVADCEALGDLAKVIGREKEAEELRGRGEKYRAAMQKLWDEKRGMFLNRRTDTGEFSSRISPTNFYALLAGAATEPQAKRMVEEHLYNPQEFWGEWVLPSISRNDAAYKEQNYWRGRIWAPLNFLVYLGLRRAKQSRAASDLAKKSAELLLKEWRQHGHVHENYDANNGEGCNISSSDRFYHWGGLLGIPALIEAGHLAAPEEPVM
ncbi:MAG TPA: trehalase family glycosidase [Tepidisphaeraceae bacterium]|jgi:hypothetical protein